MTSFFYQNSVLTQNLGQFYIANIFMSSKVFGSTLISYHLFQNIFTSFSGKKSGLGVQLEKEFKRPIPVKHHCLAHRLDLVTEAAMESFDIFANLEKYLRNLISFYHVSHKRMNDLIEFVKAINEPKFRLSTIFDVRWIASFKIAVEKVLKHISPLEKHLDYIVKNPKEFTKNKPAALQEKVKPLLKFLRNKNAMVVLFFNYDIVDLFATESLYAQKKGSTLIGMSQRKKSLLADLTNIKQLKGKEFLKFLDSCRCFTTLGSAQAYVKSGSSNQVCADLDQFENSPFVVYKKVILSDTELKTQETQQPEFSQLSTFVSEYVNELVSEADNWMPSDEFQVFGVLDPSKWSVNIRNRRFRVPDVRELATLFNMDPVVVQEEFRELVKRMMGMLGSCSWFRDHKKDDPIYFWAMALNKFKPGPQITLLIKKVLAVPMGELCTFRIIFQT